MKKIFTCMILIEFFALKANAQLIINGEFRPRAEYCDGYRKLATDEMKPAFFVSQRTRLGVFYQKEWLQTGLSIQDVRVWGDENLYTSTGVYGDNASLDLNEAWVQLLFLKKSSIKIGRQIFDYDDARLLSKRNWNQNSMSYDAILYTFRHEKWAIDIAGSFNNDLANLFGNPYTPNKMKTLNFARLNHRFTENLNASATFILSGFTKDETSEIIYFKESYAAYLQYKVEKMNIWGSVYYQGGKDISTGYSRHVNAFNFNIYASRKLNKFLMGAGASILSGDRNKGVDTTQTNLFDLFYGTRHNYYGYMDYFNNLGTATKNGGLVDAFVNVAYQVNSKFSLQLDYHFFSLEQLPNPELVKNQNITKKSMGSEIDLTFALQLMKNVNLTGGYSAMFPTSTMEMIQNSVGATRYSSWAWLMLTVKPEFLRWEGK